MDLYQMPEATDTCDRCGENTYQTEGRTYHCHSMNADCYVAPLRVNDTGMYGTYRNMPSVIRGVN